MSVLERLDKVSFKNGFLTSIPCRNTFRQSKFDFKLLESLKQERKKLQIVGKTFCINVLFFIFLYFCMNVEKNNKAFCQERFGQSWVFVFNGALSNKILCFFCNIFLKKFPHIIAQ